MPPASGSTWRPNIRIDVTMPATSAITPRRPNFAPPTLRFPEWMASSAAAHGPRLNAVSGRYQPMMNESASRFRNSASFWFFAREATASATCGHTSRCTESTAHAVHGRPRGYHVTANSTKKSGYVRMRTRWFSRRIGCSRRPRGTSIPTSPLGAVSFGAVTTPSGRPASPRRRTVRRRRRAWRARRPLARAAHPPERHARPAARAAALRRTTIRRDHARRPLRR